ncbi:MAG: class I SAM-dependent methyltransferase [Methanotrichaceae archaeon]|nr:class I SAM-dependent methyltransferase [Methanotrichaceae archaeon]
MTNENRCNCRVHGQKSLRRGRSSFWMHDPELVFAELALKEGDCFLDMGCGPGDYAIRASEIVGDSGAVYALDRWPDVIEDLAAKAKSRGLRKLKAIVSDISDPLPIKDECVDVCFISTVLHSLSLVDVGGIIFSEIRRVLRHGGRLAIIECKKEEQNVGPPIDMRLSPEQLEDPIARCGFEKEGLVDLGYNYLIKFTKKIEIY